MYWLMNLSEYHQEIISFARLFANNLTVREEPINKWFEEKE